MYLFRRDLIASETTYYGRERDIRTKTKATAESSRTSSLGVRVTHGAQMRTLNKEGEDWCYIFVLRLSSVSILGDSRTEMHEENGVWFQSPCKVAH
eukprot:scaffold17667_cov216-Amphora_coffeaeformis.AAC.3